MITTAWPTTNPLVLAIVNTPTVPALPVTGKETDEVEREYAKPAAVPATVVTALPPLDVESVKEVFAVIAII